MADHIARNWQALSGKNNWEGLLDPIDVNLRSYLIHYGKMVAAVADAMDLAKQSKLYGFSRYPQRELFNLVGLIKGNPFEYLLTKYFYIKSKVDIEGMTFAERSAWMGYVAVSTDKGKLNLGRRDILVCWRGTKTGTEWLNNFMLFDTPAGEIFEGANNNPQVHIGFYNNYTAKDDKEGAYTNRSAREQVLAEIKRLVEMYSKEEVSITVAGHSLGAALATLNAMDIVFNGYNKPSGKHSGFPVTVFAYDSPRVGDEGFKEVFDGLTSDHIISNPNPMTSINSTPIKFSTILKFMIELPKNIISSVFTREKASSSNLRGNLRLLRITNANDLIPKAPPDSGYTHVGIELKIDSRISPHLRPIAAHEAHDLNIYMHGIAGYQGENRGFELVAPHDIALVNKYTSALKEPRIPPEWWEKRNNIIFQTEDGTWQPNYPQFNG